MSNPDTRPPTIDELPVHTSGRSESPDLRFLHYNDVYHVEPGSREPVGGIARFQTLCNHYRSDAAFHGQPDLLTLFSGDAFNPSLESSVTKGKHMIPVLNGIGTDVACVGNHDLDFGVPQFRYLAGQCNFPWLLANVLDPALGEGVPLGNAQRTLILTASNGIKVGIVGLVEREWLDTINSLPPNLQYLSASATAKELCPILREQGADIIIAITHAREPNDVKLAQKVPEGLIDMIVGGHDHFYGHSIVNGTHLLRSGTDFKQLSYIKAWREKHNRKRWDFDIVRRDVMASIPEDPATLELVEKLTASLKTKLEKPIGYTLAPLDGRFTTVRLKESNLGNFVADLMRLYYGADCAIMAAGTIRGDQIYPPGVLKLKDIMNCFPFEDPVVVIEVSGAAILSALENSVSTYPALEGRFPQVSNLRFKFDPDSPPHSRIFDLTIGGAPLSTTHHYKLATRDYMARGKDGFSSLLYASAGGQAKEIISEENGILISMILRQYFMSLKVLGLWKRWGKSLNRHWEGVNEELHEVHPVKNSVPPSPEVVARVGGGSGGAGAGVRGFEHDTSVAADVLKKKLHSHLSVKDPVKDATHQLTTPTANGHAHPTSQSRRPSHVAHPEVDSESEDEEHVPENVPSTHEYELSIMRKVLRKWWRVAGLPGHPGIGHEEEGEFTVAWTKGIAPRTEGRTRVGKRPT